MAKRRVLITGLGAITPLGGEVGAYWSGLLRGQSSAAEFVLPGPGTIDNRRYYPAAECAPARVGNAPQPRSVSLAVRAAEMAMQDAGLAPRLNLQRPRLGVAVGTAMGAYDTLESHQVENSAPTLSESFPHSRVGAAIAVRTGALGPNLVVCSACAASGYSIGLAQDAIVEDRADVMIAGGVDIHTQVLAGCFNRLGALDPEVCRPFDAGRQGTLFGEGAAMLVLESNQHAHARRARIRYGEVLGAGWSCDGYHITAPEPTGTFVEQAMRDALTAASVSAGDIDCVLVHGTGTPLNDETEGQALVRVFGERVSEIAITAIKSVTGHLGGAAGALACLTAALILCHAQVPPTANLVRRDERCGIRLVVGAPRPLAARHVLVNCYAFGGNNISLVIGRPHA